MPSYFTYFFLVLGLVLVCILFLYAFKRLKKGNLSQILWKDYNRKMWMTFCLGFSFFGFYFLIVNLSIYYIKPLGSDLFFLAYHNPTVFVYGGLFLFACLTLSIYFFRMLIKYLYLTRGNDS